MIKLKKIAPYLSGIAFATIFGFSFLIVKNTLESVEIFQLLGLRFLTAAIVFELLRITKVIKINLKLKDLKIILPVAVFQPILYFISEVYGIKNSATSEAGLFIGMIPVAVALISWIFLNEKLNAKQTIFMVMSLAGVIFISVMQMNGTIGTTKPIGYLFLVGAVISAAFYNMFSRKASSKHSSMEITYVMMLTGAVVFNCIGLIDSAIKDYSYFSPILSMESVAAILYLGILSSIVAFFFVNFTLSRMPATQGSLFANLITVISIIAGVVFLNEDFSIYKIIGSVLIIIGVWGANYFQKRDK